MTQQGRRILVTGARGLVGSALCAQLRARGDVVVELAHRPRVGACVWDIQNKQVDASALEGLDAVVHLAGERIVGLWTAEKKRRIAGSRIESTSLLAHTLAGLVDKPKVMISASAIGYYGLNPSGVADESSPAGDSFLADVCTVWEGAAEPARAAGIRVVHPRIGMVLAQEGGALQKMLPAFEMALGGRLGSGRQRMSWITLGDLVRSLLWMLDHEQVEGAVNAVAPEFVDNRTFTQTLARALHRPAVLPLPAWVLRLFLGDMARELLLNDLAVVPQKLNEAGFGFECPSLDRAWECFFEEGASKTCCR